MHLRHLGTHCYITVRMPSTFHSVESCPVEVTSPLQEASQNMTICGRARVLVLLPESHLGVEWAKSFSRHKWPLRVLLPALFGDS